MHTPMDQRLPLLCRSFLCRRGLATAVSPPIGFDLKSSSNLFLLKSLIIVWAINYQTSKHGVEKISREREF